MKPQFRLHLLSPLAALITAAALTLPACQTDTDLSQEPGASIISQDTEVIIDSSFTITGAKTLQNNALLARTTTQLLGAINAPEYGQLNADFVCQLFPSNNIDTAENVTPDSLKLQLVFEKSAFVGDSTAPIGIKAFTLDQQLPYPIFSSFDPSAPQIYDPSKPLGQTTFTATAISINDTAAAANYRFAYIPMPQTLLNGIIDKYKQAPSLFNDPYLFQNFLPGIYVKHTFGSGRVTRITDCRLIYYYHKTYQTTDTLGNPTDSISNLYTYIMAMAPELVSNTSIDITPSPSLVSRADQGQTIIAAPAAYDAQIQLPIQQILTTLRNLSADALTVTNTLTLSIPADSIPSASRIAPPPYLLLVPSCQKEQFFIKNALPDNTTSFLGTYNPNTKTYTFGDLKQYITHALALPSITPDDYTYTLTPVTPIVESTSNSQYDYTYLYNPYYTSSSVTTQISAIAPMTAMPAMVRLRPENAKIKLTLSRQTK